MLIPGYDFTQFREADRTVMLKLSDISQDRIDQAIGRLIRKCSNVLKAAFPGPQLTNY